MSPLVRPRLPQGIGTNPALAGVVGTMPVMDELVDAVSRHAHLPPDQASLAVGGVLRFLAARLPSPLFGELQARLQATDADAPAAVPGAEPAGLSGAATPPRSGRAV
ncbi:MAG: hypothetical protein RL375_2862 [Pseudomonadota bacterium]